MLQPEEFLFRFERLKEANNLNDDEAAKQLGYTRQTIWRISKRLQNVTKSAVLRLIDAERAAGISSPSPAPQTPASAPEGTPIKNSTILEKGSEKGIDREELRRTIDDLKRLLGDLERIYKRK
jgi:hypothetical protein